VLLYNRFGDGFIMQKILRSKFLMLAIFILFSLFLEVLMFFYIKVGFIPKYVLFNVCTLALLGSVIFFIPTNKGSLIYLSIVIGIQCVSNVVNCVMYENCGDVFSVLYFKLFNEAVRVFEFDFFNIGRILLFIGIVVGYVLLNVLLMKKNIIPKIDKENSYWLYLKKQILWFTCVVVVFTSTYILQVSYIKSQDKNDVFSDSYLWSSLNLKVEGLKNFGTWGYYAKETQKLFFSSKTPSKSLIDEVNNYLNDGEYQKTEYFGLLEDKNVIMIMMESFQWFGVDEYLTPNLYNLAKDNLAFSNHYSKNKTNVSEMIGITGSYPITNTLDPEDIDYSFTNSILNYLGDEYTTTYVHANTSDYYTRGDLMPQLGFDNMYFFDELYPDVKLWDWGDFSLDSETMKRAISYLIPDDGNKFYSYITTLSTHGPYNESKKNTKKLTEKGYFDKIDDAIEKGLWINPLGDTPIAESFKYYKAMSMDLDAAIGMLVEKLENEGLMDDTIIVMYGDHNAYYDDISYRIYNSVGGEYYKSYIFKTPLIICNKELTDAYKEKNNISEENSAHVEKFVSTYNIVPTLLDLLGYEYNSNFYLGTSVFNEVNYDETNIFFSLQGGIFNDKIYTINGYDLVYTELKDYQKELETVRIASELILKKIKYIEYIYNYNMFDYIVVDLENK